VNHISRYREGKYNVLLSEKKKMNPKDIQISICTRVTEAKYSDFRVLITSVQYKIASFMNITNCYKNKTPKKKKQIPLPKRELPKIYG
jgi:uncharacterized protein YfbU (UPF0304 family)